MLRDNIMFMIIYLIFVVKKIAKVVCLKFFITEANKKRILEGHFQTEMKNFQCVLMHLIFIIVITSWSYINNIN